MVDQACGFVPGQSPIIIPARRTTRHPVILRCPECKDEFATSRDASWPKQTALVLFACRKCRYDGSEIYFYDLQGKELFLNLK